MARSNGRRLIVLIHGVALIGLSACASGRGYSIASSAPLLGDEQVAQPSDVSGDEDNSRGRFRRFYFRRGGDGILIAAAAPAGTAGFAPVSLSPTAPNNGGLLYLAGNLLPATGLAGPLNGLTGGAGSLLQSAVATSAGGVAGVAGGTVNAVNQTGLVNASLGSNGAAVGPGSGAGAVAVSVTPTAGGASTGVAVSGTGASVSTGVAGGGVSVGLAGALGGVAGGGLSVGLGRTTGGGLVSINTTSTNSNLLKGR